MHYCLACDRIEKDLCICCELRLSVFPGHPELVPPARNYTSVAAPGEAINMNYHSVVIEKNNSGLHMLIIPENQDDYFDVYVQVRKTLMAFNMFIRINVAHPMFPLMHCVRFTVGTVPVSTGP